MDSLKIGIDIDGVIVNLVEAMRTHLSDACGYFVSDDHIYCFDIGKALNIENEMENIWKKVYESDCLRRAPAIEGAIEGMNKIKDNYIWLITERPEKTKDDTERWLNSKSIKYDKLEIGGNHKQFVMNKGIDIFIEDNFEQAQSIAETGVCTLLLDHPWNRKEIITNKCKRVKSWNEILKEIEILIKSSL